jgi:uncharacterized cupredoxin-like copper-binding protein
MSRRWVIASIATVLAAGVTACGGGQSDTSGQAAKKAGSTSTSDGAKQTSAAAGGHVSVVMSDFKFAPTNLTASPGKLKVTAKNTGQQEHEFVLLRTDKAPDAIPLENGEASESGSVGEISEQHPGASATRTFELEHGHYVFICNVDGHYQAGMRGSLTVK